LLLSDNSSVNLQSTKNSVIIPATVPSAIGPRPCGKTRRPRRLGPIRAPSAIAMVPVTSGHGPSSNPLALTQGDRGMDRGIATLCRCRR
jgi:hypothetical protein